jgi:hypothetical protein
MRTRFGRECTYYYEDFRRGRELQECRLLGKAAGWKPALCRNCPVPGILNANACPEMVLRGSITQGILGFGRRVKITTWCRRSNRADFDPHIGCGECHKVLQEIQTPK